MPLAWCEPDQAGAETLATPPGFPLDVVSPPDPSPPRETDQSNTGLGYGVEAISQSNIYTINSDIGKDIGYEAEAGVVAALAAATTTTRLPQLAGGGAWDGDGWGVAEGSEAAACSPTTGDAGADGLAASHAAPYAPLTDGIGATPITSLHGSMVGAISSAISQPDALPPSAAGALLSPMLVVPIGMWSEAEPTSAGSAPHTTDGLTIGGGACVQHRALMTWA